MKAMKKFIIPALAIMAIFASCSKEDKVIEEPVDNTVTVKGTINNTDTKSDYDISGDTAYFHWSGTEYIGVMSFNGQSDKPQFWQTAFESTSSATSETSLVFSGTDDGKTIGYAFYPRQKIGGNTNPNCLDWGCSSGNGYKLRLYLYESLTYHADAPLKDVVPMIGKLDGTAYDFVPITAVIAVRVKNLPSTASKITLASTGTGLSGWYHLTDYAANNYVSNFDYTRTNGLTKVQASNANNTSGTKTYTFSGLGKGEYTFYFPVTVGTLSDLSVIIKDSGDNELQRVSYSKSLTTAKAQITKLPLMDLAKATKVQITGDANNAYLHVDTFGPDATSVKFAVASTESAASSAVASGTSITATGESNKQNIYSGLTDSGKYYLAYTVYDSSNNALRSEVKMVYYINNSDAAQLAGDYAISYSSWTCGAFTNDNDPSLVKRMILAVSDDLSKGNIMMTEFLGYNYVVSQNRSTANLNWSGSLTNGSPLYGEYPTMVSSYTCVSFLNVNNQDGLFSDNAGSYYPRNNANNQPDYSFIVSNPTVLTCVAGTTAFAKRSTGAWSGAGTKVEMTNVVATKVVD